jgi:hypothetical protein
VASADFPRSNTLPAKKRDEALSCPPLSTGELGKSGKLRVADLVRMPIQAHFQAVFRRQTEEKRSRKALKFRRLTLEDGGGSCPRALRETACGKLRRFASWLV